MIKIIVHAFVESHKTGVVEVVFASKNEQSISEKMAELQIQYPNDYLAIYDLPLDRDLPKMGHYPSVAIGKEEFEWGYNIFRDLCHIYANLVSS